MRIVFTVLSDQSKRSMYDAGLYDPLEEEDQVRIVSFPLICSCRAWGKVKLCRFGFYAKTDYVVFLALCSVTWLPFFTLLNFNYSSYPQHKIVYNYYFFNNIIYFIVQEFCDFMQEMISMMNNVKDEVVIELWCFCFLEK